MNTFDVEYQSFKLPSSILKDSILFVRRDEEDRGLKKIEFYVGDIRFILQSNESHPRVDIINGFKKMVLA